MSKARVFFSFGNLDARVEMHQVLFDPLGRPLDNCFRVVHPCVYFAPHESHIDFRAAVTGNEFRILHAEQVCEDPASDVDRVPHGLGADTYPGRRTQLFQIDQPGLLVRQKKILGGAIGAPEVDQLGKIVLNTDGAENGIGDESRSHAAERKAIRLCPGVDVVCGLPASPRFHVLHHDRRVSGKMLAQKRSHGLCPQVRGSSGGPPKTTVIVLS